MSDGICFAGLDVHARKTAAAAVRLGSGEVWKALLPGSAVAAIEWLQALPGPVHAVYEAGPTGFELARAARAAGVEVMVCAPGAIPGGAVGCRWVGEIGSVARDSRLGSSCLWCRVVWGLFALCSHIRARCRQDAALRCCARNALSRFLHLLMYLSDS